MISYNIGQNTLNVNFEGEPYSIPRVRVTSRMRELLDNPMITHSADLQEKLKIELDKARAVEDYTEGNLQVRNNVVWYAGEPLDGRVADKILEFMHEGLPYQALINFLDRLMNNPSKNVIDQLYPFLEHCNIQISPEGYIIGYKGVRRDYYDVFTGTVYNGPNAQPERMKQNQVDDNPNVGCSQGYHVGSFEYAKGWGPVVMRVCVDPADVRSVPHDCAHQKMRTSFYTILEQADVDEIDRNGVSPMSESMREHYWDPQQIAEEIIEDLEPEALEALKAKIGLVDAAEIWHPDFAPYAEEIEMPDVQDELRADLSRACCC